MWKQEQTVRWILSEVLRISMQTVSQIDLKEDLQYFGMDSLNCMQVIVTLEDTFAFTIPEDKLGLKYIRNIYDICRLVEEGTGHGSV